MNSEIFKGQLRELLSAAGAALITFGIATGAQVEAGSGFVLSVVMLIWAMRSNVGGEKVMSLTRKAFGAVGAMIVVLEILSEDKTLALLAIIGPIVAMLMSFWQHGGKLDFDRLGIFVVGFLALAFFPSCSISDGVQVRGPVTGLTYKQGPDGLMVEADEDTVTWWQEVFWRVQSGEKIGDVLSKGGEVNFDK